MPTDRPTRLYKPDCIKCYQSPDVAVLIAMTLIRTWRKSRQPIG